MKFLDSFKKLFSKKGDEGTEEKRQKIERTLNAKILKDMEKEKAKKMTVHDFEKEEKEKEMRRLIEKKRTKQKKEDMAKKRNKTLSANF